MTTSSASLAAAILNQFRQGESESTISQIIEPEPFCNSGKITHMERLRKNFKSFGLDMHDVLHMMKDTSIVIGGGFMVNHILAMTGIDKPLPPTSDLDFYVYGGIVPPFSGSITDVNTWHKYHTDRLQASAFKILVMRRFHDLIYPVGYKAVPPDWREYGYEHSEAGDRIFTTGSNIQMNIQYYEAIVNGERKKLNLVFCNTSMYDLITKVDIGICAGFFCPSMHDDTFDYHHAVPEDVVEHRISWMQPESTHTVRQQARVNKYREYYNILETQIMTPDEFIRDYDTLPDEHIHIVLIGTEEQIHSKHVVRRVLGLPNVKFSIQMTSLNGAIVYANFPDADERAKYARSITMKM